MNCTIQAALNGLFRIPDIMELEIKSLRMFCSPPLRLSQRFIPVYVTALTASVI
jgi:hypothetical protein